MTKTQKTKLIAIILAAAVLGAIVFQNTETVTTRILMIRIQMPLIVLQLVAVGGGFLLGYLSAGMRARRKG